MRPRTIRLFLFLGLLPLPAYTAESIYTDLSGKTCTLFREDEVGSTAHLCPGVDGYKLLVLYGDDRMSINVVSPDGVTHELNYWKVITNRFSHLGEKAEWRVVGKKKTPSPIGLIVQVNAAEDDSDPKKITSYLAVAKITPKAICVTDKIAASPTAQEIARKAADTSSRRECVSAE